MTEGIRIQVNTEEVSTEWVEGEIFPAKVPILPCKDTKAAVEEARTDVNSSRPVSKWTDELRIDSGKTEIVAAWKNL